MQWSAQEPGCLPLTPVALFISLILGKALVYSVPNFLICEMELLVLPTLGSCWGISKLTGGIRVLTAVQGLAHSSTIIHRAWHLPAHLAAQGRHEQGAASDSESKGHGMKRDEAERERGPRGPPELGSPWGLSGPAPPGALPFCR